MKRRTHKLILYALLMSRAGVGLAQNVPVAATQLPSGGKVMGGQASIQSSGASMTVNQTSARAVIDWNTFNIGAQAKVNFNQASPSAVVLNRVLDSNPSQILGQLSATGQVFISNPNGVIFGTTARVDVGGLVATTQGMSTSDFMAGKSTFSGGNADASVLNQGTLQAALGGYIALMAPQVRNEGVIIAREGTVALAAGAQTTLDFNGTRLVSVIVEQPVLNALIENKQLIRAEGGYVVMAARSASTLMRAVINNSGSIQAPTLVEKQGRIVLEGGEQGLVQVGGSLNVSASDAGTQGGSIAITGDKVLVTADARLDATGPGGGGKINVGGGWQGQDASIRNANATVVEAGARLDASASDNGNGGEVVVYSNTQNSAGLTRVAGELLARGGPNGGNGGRIETSGHWVSTDGAKGDASAVKGQAGQWLFDPYNVSITAATNNNSVSSGTWTPSGSTSTILNTAINDLLNAGTNVTVTTGSTGAEAGNISVNAAITQSASAPAARLTLNANQDITINQAVTMTKSGSKLELIGGNATTGGNVVFNAAVNADTVSMTLTGPGSTVTQANAGVLTTNNLRISGTQTDVILLNAANNVGVMSANVKSIALTSDTGIDQNSPYGKGTYVGTVEGVSGVTASGAINLSSNSNLFVNENVISASTGSDAVKLNAGASQTVGANTGSDSATNPYGPNVILTSNKTITTGTGGRATVYMGSTSGSGTNLASYANSQTGGVARYRYNSDETTTNYSTALGTGLYVILRQNPNLTVTANSSSTVYGATLSPATSTTITGYLNSDSQAQAVSSSASVVIGGTQSSAGYWTAGTHSLTASGAASGLGYGFNYVNGTLTVTPKTMTIAASVTNGGKTYDGSAVAATQLTTGDRVGADVVSLSSTTSTYNNKNAGSGKAVTVSGLAISGADAANYSLSSTTATTSGNITQKDLTASFTASNKVYDGNTAATLSGSSADVISGDTVTFGGTGTFANKNVGTGKVVSVANIALGGTDAANYHLLSSTALTSADITAKSITPAYSATNKVYDGGVNATVTANTSAIVANDAVTFANTSATFADKAVGTGKTVTVAGITISGNDAANYTLASNSATTSANITPKTLTISGITAADKIYDGSTTATVSTANATKNGLVVGDTVTISSTGLFSSKNAGIGKTVNLTNVYAGADANNYSIVDQGTTSASINQRSLAVSAVANNKVYDGSRNATYTLSSDMVSGDNLTLNAATALFDTKNVGTGKGVLIGGITVTGADSGNYYLQNSSTASSANITAKQINVAYTASNKVYDGGTTATVAANTSQIVSGDDVTFANTAATFADKNAGTSKTVTVSGVSISGADATNYALSANSASTSANITPKELSIAGITVSNKIYDGTTAATVSVAGVTKSGLIGGDSVNVAATGAFVTKNVGTGKLVNLSSTYSGSDVANYNITSQSTATADVTQRSLTVNATAMNKTYDATRLATYTLSSDQVAGDTLSLSATSALFDNKNVGTGKTVTINGISVAGTDAANYSLSSSTASTTANVTPKAITTSGITAASKVYDASDAASINVASAALTAGASNSTDKKYYTGDSVQVDTSAASGAFTAGKNAGNGKAVTVTGLTLSGTDAGNYTVSDASGATANITPKAITSSGITAANKVYDATANATVNVSAATLTNGAATSTDKKFYTGDVVQLSTTNAVGTFTGGKNVGNGKAVTVSGLTLTGTDAANYSITDDSGATANITTKAITASGITAANKVYDATNAATLNVSGAALTSGGSTSSDNKYYTGDAVQVVASAASGTFANKNAGSSKAVSITGLTLSGADAANYTVSDASGASATISQKTITVSGITASDKVYNASTAATINTASAALTNGASTSNDNKYYSADQVQLVTAAASGAFANKNVGTNKAVTVSGLTLSGTDAANYAVTDASGATATITAKALTVTGITASDRVYDGSTAATLLTNNATLASGATTSSDNKYYAGDMVQVNTASAAGTFAAGKNVGTNKAVNVSGLTLTGSDAGNYTVTDASGATATITARNLNVSTQASDKVYDTTRTASYSLSSDQVSGDALTLGATSGMFDTKNVGTGKTVTVSGIAVSGADANNYALQNTSATTTANITPKAITATGIAAANKVYDASNVATLNTTAATLTNGAANSADNKFYSTDQVQLVTTHANGVFAAGKNVGAGKAVSISGLSLSGTDAANYTVSDASNATANITAKAITASGITAANKVYDASTSATLNTSGATLTGGAANSSDQRYYSGDTVQVVASGASGVFGDKNVGTGKAVSVSGLTLSGGDAGNYTVTDASGATANITPKAITTSGITASNKTYDGTDVAALNLTQASLTNGATSSTDKKYYSGDVLQLVTNAATGSFAAGKNVGNGKAVTVSGLSLVGTDAGNYTVSDASAATANISQRALTVTATANDKVYDTTRQAGFNLASDQVTGDNLSLSASSALFDTKNVGTGKTVSVTGIAVGGTDAGNYSLQSTSATTTAAITPKALTASGVTANDKTYDGNNSASLNLGSASLVAGASNSSDNKYYSGEDVRVSTTGATGQFVDGAAAGNQKAVSVSGLSLSGADAGNYTVTNASDVKASITAVKVDANCVIGGAAACNYQPPVVSTPTVVAAAGPINSLLNSANPQVIKPSNVPAVSLPVATSAPINASSLSSSALSQLSAGDLAGVLPTLNASQLQAITPSQANALPAPQRQELANLMDTANRVRQLDTRQVAQLPATQLASMIRFMSPSQLLAITDSQVSALPPARVGELLTQLEALANGKN